MPEFSRKTKRNRRRLRMRRKIVGTAEVPRFCVYISGRHIYAQLIDDQVGHTLTAQSTMDPALRKKKVRANVKGAELIGKLAGEKAVALGLKKVVFDRAGFRYHGRIGSVADAARKAGLTF